MVGDVGGEVVQQTPAEVAQLAGGRARRPSPAGRLGLGQKAFGIGRVQKPRFRHGSYAFYFVDGDSNWWEVEYRTPELLYTTLREKGDQH